MKIVIFGATGFSGKMILSEALSKHHQVVVLVRSKAAVKLQNNNLTVIEGDVLNRQNVAQALNNCDAVIQCLGVGGKGTGKPTTFISDATRIIVEEMEKQQINRLVVMSNVGAGNSIAFLPWFFTRLVMPYFMKWLKVIIDDKNRMESIIMNSRLNWTIVRFPNIVDKPEKGKVHITLDGKGLQISITLGDAAKLIVGQLDETTYSRQAPSVSN